MFLGDPLHTMDWRLKIFGEGAEVEFETWWGTPKGEVKFFESSTKGGARTPEDTILRVFDQIFI